MASSSPRRARFGDEEFMVDLLAKLFGYGCAWVIFLAVAVCTAGSIGAVMLIAQLVDQ